MTQVFSSQFRRTFKNTFSTEHLWTTASIINSYGFECFKNPRFLQNIFHDRLWNQNKDTPQIY